MRISFQFLAILSVSRFFFFFVLSLFLGFWIFSWPGIYSPDVSYALRCAENMEGLSCFLTENSLFWAFINYLSAYWNSSFSIFLFFQILFISFVYSYGLKVFSSSRTQRNFYLLLFFFQLGSFLPLRMAIFVERDTLYSYLWFFVVLLLMDSWKNGEESIQKNRVRFSIILIVCLLASLLRSEGWIFTGVFLFAWSFHKRKSIALPSILLGIGMTFFCFWGLQFLQGLINPNAQSVYLSHFHRSYVPFMIWERGTSISVAEEEFLKQVYKYPPADIILPEVNEDFLADPRIQDQLQQISMDLLISNPHQFLLHRILLLKKVFLRTPVHYGKSQLESTVEVPSKPGKSKNPIDHSHLGFRGPFQSLAISLEHKLEALFANPKLRLIVFQPTFGLLTLGILLCFGLLNPAFFPLLSIPLVHFVFIFLFQFAAMPKHLFLQYLCLLLLPALELRRSLKP